MNIRVDLNTPIKDGTEVIFRSPIDCASVTGLIVYYKGTDGDTASQEFAFADAHGNNVGDIDHLFAENVAVKVILDVTTGMAFVQNADTNAYLEGRFSGIESQDMLTGIILGSIQTVTFNADGTIQKVLHKDAAGNVLRTDSFSYAGDTITETRTLSNGKTVTFTINTNTLTTEVR